MYLIFIAGTGCINARFMYKLVYSFIYFDCVICILLITICTILLAVFSTMCE